MSARVYSPTSFGKEGFTLRLIINKLARTLLEKGYIDEDCENKIINYRQKRLQYYPIRPKNAKRISLSAGNSMGFLRDNERNSMKMFRRDASSLRVPDENSPRRRFPQGKSDSNEVGADALFLLLGEILVRQFQCTVNMEDGNVHERELKLIIWKHFVQTLVAALIEKQKNNKSEKSSSSNNNNNHH
uniref:Uncharacterized protein n=1 Tax=Panagrolaimus davidi TaxID=227884 RepID=A0A914QJB9_9BILA